MLKTALPVLSVTDAELAYADCHALRGACLDLYAGELLGLLGPNGAGKTSLVSCLAGRQPLDSGQIEYRIDGVVQDAIGVVPQHIALYPDLTVSQNLSVFGRLQGIPSTELRHLVGRALEWSRLQEKARALVGTLSGGMQRRLNIACSVLHDPQVLLLDEPTVGVDPQSRESIYEMLSSLLDEGTAVLLTTHHLEEAETRCDRIAIIDEGAIIECGTFEELLSRTIGSSQQLQIQFASRQRRVPAPLRLSNDGWEASCNVQNATIDVPRVLQHLKAQAFPVEQLHLRSPSLQNMFLHLTGKELRE